jgi:hypothetical protein
MDRKECPRTGACKPFSPYLIKSERKRSGTSSTSWKLDLPRAINREVGRTRPHGFASRGLCADLLELVLLEHDLVVGQNVLRALDKALREKVRLPAARVAEIAELVSRRSRPAG